MAWGCLVFVHLFFICGSFREAGFCCEYFWFPFVLVGFFLFFFLVGFLVFLLCHSCSEDPLCLPPASSPSPELESKVGWGRQRSGRGGLVGSHSALAPASGPPGPPGVCAATSLQVEDAEDEEDEDRPGDLLEMEAATAAAAADTRPTPGGALSRGSPAWFRKRGEVTRPGLPGAAPAAPSTRLPLPSRLVRGSVPPEARAGAGAQA